MPDLEIEGSQDSPKELESRSKMRVLVLEDSYGDVARESLEAEGFEVTIAKSLDELKELQLDLNPDFVILDVNVPNKEGDTPQDVSADSKSIIDEKFSSVPVYYYTSIAHSGRYIQAGIGKTPEDAKGMVETVMGSTSQQGERAEGVINNTPDDIKEKIQGIGDKSNGENWKNIFGIVGLITTDSQELLDIYKKLPIGVRNSSLDFLRQTKPELCSSIERNLSHTESTSQTNDYDEVSGLLARGFDKDEISINSDGSVNYLDTARRNQRKIKIPPVEIDGGASDKTIEQVAIMIRDRLKTEIKGVEDVVAKDWECDDPKILDTKKGKIIVIGIWGCEGRRDPSVKEIQFYDENGKFIKSEPVKNIYKPKAKNFYEVYPRYQVVESESETKIQISMIESDYIGFHPHFGNQYRKFEVGKIETVL